MHNELRDTIVTHTFDSICVIGASCKIHNHIHHQIINNNQPLLLVNTIIDDSTIYIYENQWGQVLYLDEQITKFDPIIEINSNSLPVIPFRASDTIQPCDAKWLNKGKMLELKAYSIQKCNNKMAEDYLYCDLSNSIVMMLMLFATSVWLYNSIFHWAEMISKINKIVKD